MVWSQYLYEGTHGTEVDPDESNDTTFIEEDEYGIQEWELEYGEELRELWNMIQILLRDAWIEKEILYRTDYWEFVEFCYEDSWNRYFQNNTINIVYRDKLYYIWQKMNEYRRDAGLQGQFWKGANFSHFMDFVTTNSKLRF